ncbi:MAG: excinuclease ABC subunit UvrC [Candidatus Omnitrophota bacterium]
MEINKKINALPDTPGVYLMKDAAGTIIYVGKAASLKKRVSSYFTKAQKPLKQKVLVSKIRDIDFVSTFSEAEALILEAALIKEYNPKYNSTIKDDKAYPFLKLTIREKYPRLCIVRSKKKDKAVYFGPYTSAALLKQALNFMRRIFPLRTCNVMPKTFCLNFHLNQCLGPCVQKNIDSEYKQVVHNLLLFLRGKKSDLIKNLKAEMTQTANIQNFEKAIKLRDKIEYLSAIPITEKRYNIVDQIQDLQAELRLKDKPLIIEGFDISNIQGSNAVGSMVRFLQGYPVQKEYRRFKIKFITSINDYAMIQEVLKRRFSGNLKDTLTFPNLILIDGGYGHLQAAVKTLRVLNIKIPIISIAKKFEHIYVTWQNKPVALRIQSKALRLLMRIRDESHRFALAYHRNLRKKQMLLSELDQIPGIGPKRRQLLQNALTSKEVKTAKSSNLGLKQMSLKKLKEIKGIDEKTAKNIIEHWKKY